MGRTCVDDTICNREVDRREQQDWFDKEHLEWTKDGALENVVESPADAFALRVNFLVLLGVGHAQTLRLSCEEHRRKSLRKEEEAEERA